MAQFNRTNLRKLILQELKQLVDEDALLPSPELGDPHYYDLEDEEACPKCGTHHDLEMSACPKDHNHNMGMSHHGKAMDQDLPVLAYLEEDCGCGGSDHDDEIMHASPHGNFSELEDMDMPPNQSLAIALVDDDQHHKSSSYMARPQLYKIAKYAVELLDMVEEDEQLDDWQESKIAQISQMIGSVYHSLDYKKNY